METQDNQSDLACVCKNLYKAYGEGPARVEALRGVDLTIRRGELRMLMGPSGSGKTTLISIIAGILTQDSGEYRMNNIDLNHLSNGEKTHFRGSNIGFVFQAFNLIPSLTLEENIAIPLLLNNAPRKEALGKAKELLEKLGMGDKIGKYPRQLSGGQQQRVAIARAVVHDPVLIVCDEPTSALDHETGNNIMELFKSMITARGTTLIVVTHDPRIEKFADKIDYLEDGRITDRPAA